jgi:tetratricopeptide (TPR) repeat protein
MSDSEAAHYLRPTAGSDPVTRDDTAEHELALQAAQNTTGPASIEAAAILIKLGGAHRRTGRLAEAHRAYVQALEITEEILGPDHAELARIYHSLAELELARGRFLTGEPYARRSLEICQGAAGALEKADLAGKMEMLAALLAGQGRSAESELLHRSAETLQRNPR